MGHLAGPILPHVGLDMGRACSVLLFCLSIDPLFYSIHSQSLAVQKAYMDDTTLADEGLRWINSTQNFFLNYDGAGIVVEQHVCCRFIGNTPDSHHIAGDSSWTRAAGRALATSATTFTVLDLPMRPLDRTDLVKLSHGMHQALLCSLVSLSCNCKAKTTIIPNQQLALADVLLIDKTPFGAKVIKAWDITLGLPLASKHDQVLPLGVDGQPIAARRMKVATLLARALDKAIIKLRTRANRLLLTLTPAPKRALFWTAYCQSALYFVTSVFMISSKHQKQLDRLQQRVLLGRAWLPGRLVADVFSAFRIGPASNIMLACQKANLSAYLRLYGTDALINAIKKQPQNGHCRSGLA